MSEVLEVLKSLPGGQLIIGFFVGMFFTILLTRHNLHVHKSTVNSLEVMHKHKEKEILTYTEKVKQMTKEVDEQLSRAEGAISDRAAFSRRAKKVHLLYSLMYADLFDFWQRAGSVAVLAHNESMDTFEKLGKRPRSEYREAIDTAAKGLPLSKNARRSCSRVLASNVETLIFCMIRLYAVHKVFLSEVDVLLKDSIENPERSLGESTTSAKPLSEPELDWIAALKYPEDDLKH